jgi:hypothetical protein
MADTDVIITSGYISNGNKNNKYCWLFEINQSVQMLLKINWLLPGSALFRTDTVTQIFLQGCLNFEWTYL